MAKRTLILNNLSDAYFDKGVKETKKVQYKLSYTVTEVGTSTIYLSVIYVTTPGKEGLFRLDSTDTTSVSDSTNILVSSNGNRYKRVASNTSRRELFTNLTTGNTVTLTDTPFSLTDLNVYRNGDLVLDYSITGKVITFTTSFGVSTGAVGFEEIIVTYNS